MSGFIAAIIMFHNGLFTNSFCGAVSVTVIVTVIIKSIYMLVSNHVICYIHDIEGSIIPY